MPIAWNRHAIAQTQLRRHVASMAWGARNLISTQQATQSKAGRFRAAWFSSGLRSGVASMAYGPREITPSPAQLRDASMAWG